MPRFQVSSLFTDRAVLARGKELRLFGTGEDGVRITARLTDAEGRLLGSDTAPCRDGRFLCLLPPQEAAEGCTLTFRAGEEEAVYRDIAVGDVYLAGGQSNMEMELQNARGGPALIRRHDNPRVRYYNVPKCARAGEEADRAGREARWAAVVPGGARDMSAAAYFFAMKMQRETGATVGVIDCYWGGTSIACWMDGETLDSLTEGKRYLSEYREKCRGVSLETYLEKEAAFLSAMDRWNGKVERLKRENPQISWPEISAQAGPCPWDPPAGPGSPYRPCGLYETMLRRLIPCALTGVLFYQGEEDAARTERYDQLLTAFILMLRRQFEDGGLPFINAQLPMWIAAGAEDTFTWPRIRLCQQRVCDALRNTGLAILLDQGEYDNLHPADKRPVGERLAEEAKRVIYPGLPCREAPNAIRKYTEGTKLHVLFSQPVVDRGSGETLLEIAGEDGVFYPAWGTVSRKEAVLESPRVPRPVAVRYGWTDYAPVRYFGENGLPLRPFQLP